MPLTMGISELFNKDYDALRNSFSFTSFNPAESEASGQSDINSIKTGDCLIPIPITLTENKPSSSTGSISQQAQLHTVPFHRSKSNERPGLKAKSDREEQLPYSAFVAKKVTYKANANENVKPVICSKNTKQKFNHRKQATSEIHRNLPATESNTSNKFSTKTKTRTIADCPFLDGNRRSRLESEISKALPPPSDLFFGKAETDRKHAINVPNDEIGSTTSFGAVVDVADVPSSSKLSLNGVLEPVRLLLNGQPSQQPLQSCQSATLQVGQDNSGMESLNANSTTSQPINDIQLPLLSLSNDDLPSNAPGYRFGMVLPNLPWNGTSTESTYDPCANSVLPPRLGPCTPFKMEEGKDLLEILDPLFEPSRAARGCVTSTSEQEGSITHAEQMKILYAEASFVDHSRCDQKVAKCKGNTAIALEELKIEYLVETEIASNRENAREALERNAWNLNAAANFLLNNA
ncbi:hypothetical protein DICVIV_13528 [Dictyocaulus viviparus]|uniref:UBA domain-containing protein n=1 Tax=Dictyocaulus viviparus TaxID=29172 RepID=A0A0D8X7I7_DICVI|nr:hypothetical protein DICVIV_13528 [Dictyocaulus viviparus]